MSTGWMLVKFKHSVSVVINGNGLKSEAPFIPVSGLSCLDLYGVLPIRPIGCNGLSSLADTCQTELDSSLFRVFDKDF